MLQTNMTSVPTSFNALTDDELLIEVQRLAACERAATIDLLRSLIEVDARRLYLREGCSSLFTYCTQVLHLAEGSAYNRIEAARAARRFPAILEAIADGALTLTSARLLAPHLTDDNHRALLDAARDKSKRDVERLIATFRPKSVVPTVLRKLPAATQPPEPVSRPESDVGMRPTPTEPAQAARVPAAELPVAGAAPAVERRAVPIPSEVPSAPHRAWGESTPLSADAYKLQVTISRQTHDKLRRAQDLLRHTLPTGDLAEIVDRALTLLLSDLERRRCAAAARPREDGTGTASDTRHIPAAVRRAVWQRDQGRCAFVGTRGRCRETGFLEFHHVAPYAAGGAATVDNIQLRCRAHNLYEATLFFGDGSDCVRERGVSW